ncbi:HK97 family phage prohead protease [Paraburkholderia pallida]|uniref:HK97 family phage prohead protease n=1 Tax=Paraburkholderia pallida TaxID=2547399 RepID=A0A4P7CPV1_9BURK|nr:HK97 family phage prohead protease [Paraburkholderia pallida]QBQ97865.1 HK97 family phage prohead protease [Paraburkholderia pallida]
MDDSKFDDLPVHGAVLVNEVKFDVRKSGSFSGYASVFGNVDSTGDIVDRGAWAESLGVKKSVPLLFNHRVDNLIGRALDLREDDVGLHFAGRLTEGVQLADDTYKHLKAGALDGVSVGYRIQPGGATLDGEIRHIRRASLLEISVVVAPANTLARVDPASLKEAKSEREIEAILRDAGWSKGLACQLISAVKGLRVEPGEPVTSVLQRDSVDASALLAAIRQPAAVGKHEAQWPYRGGAEPHWCF